MRTQDIAGSPQVTRLLRLDSDEAGFIEAAFERILPVAQGVIAGVQAVAYVDRKLCEPANAPVLFTYRAGVADAQGFCLRVFGRRFQALALWNQFAVLAVLERPRGTSLRRQLFYQLVNDAAEAYFDAGTPRGWGRVPAHLIR